jgi:hypothetical protein
LKVEYSSNAHASTTPVILGPIALTGWLRRNICELLRFLILKWARSSPLVILISPKSCRPVMASTVTAPDAHRQRWQSMCQAGCPAKRVRWMSGTSSMAVEDQWWRGGSGVLQLDIRDQLDIGARARCLNNNQNKTEVDSAL